MMSTTPCCNAAVVRKRWTSADWIASPVIYLDPTCAIHDCLVVAERRMSKGSSCSFRSSQASEHHQEAVVEECYCQNCERPQQDEDEQEEERDASPDNVQEASMIHPQIRRNRRFAVDTVFEKPEAKPLGYSRAEFLYVKVFVDYKQHSLSIDIEKPRAGMIYISRIGVDSPLRRSPIRPGDQIISINGVSCNEKKSTRKLVNTLLQTPPPWAIRGKVAAFCMVVRNPGGDPNLFTSSVQKRKPDDIAGIRLSAHKGIVTVSQVRPDGLFIGSLLVPGHRCVAINGTSCDMMGQMGSIHAANIIAHATDNITITSRARQESQAAVLSSYNHRNPIFWGDMLP